MAKHRRAFQEDFVQFLRNQSAWPSDVKITLWVRKVLGAGIRTGDAAKAKRGQAIPESSLRAILQMFLEPDNAANDSRKRGEKAVRAFLGIGDAGKLSAGDVFERICVVPGKQTQQLSPREDVVDWLGMGLRAIFAAFVSKRSLDRHVQGFRSADEVRKAIKWTFVQVARSISKSNDPPGAENAVTIAEEYMKIPLKEYQDRAVQWWLFHPWTVVLARGKDGPTGISIMLPLTQSAYRSTLDGERMTYDNAPADMAVPSELLLVECVIERPVDLHGENLEESTRSLIQCAVAQSAVLSRFAEIPRDRGLNLLSFAASPTAVRRLKGFGYQPTGKKMRATGIEFHTKLIPSRANSGPDFQLVQMLHRLSEILDGPPEL
jgi:hypothetical protein